MASASVEAAFDVLPLLGPSAHILVNGHGETTFHPPWKEICQRIVDAGFRPAMISNLARHFTDDDVALLARFSIIQVSLDSHDHNMMRRIRKAVGIGRVFDTIARIRAAAERNGHTSPWVDFSVGVYDPAVWTLPDFVDVLATHQVRAVTFWNLVEYDHQTEVRALARLFPAEAAKAAVAIAQACRRLQAHGIDYTFAGDFVDGSGLSLLPESTRRGPDRQG